MPQVQEELHNHREHHRARIQDPSLSILQEHSGTADPDSFRRQDFQKELSQPTAADVDLSIFNLAGQRVAMLVDDVREAGTYTIRWDGRDDKGRELASGVDLGRK